MRCEIFGARYAEVSHPAEELEAKGLTKIDHVLSGGPALIFSVGQRPKFIYFVVGVLFNILIGLSLFKIR
jgi:hypothetical protein